MAQVGNLGKQIVFETSDQRILTFTNFKQKITGRWSKNAIIGEKPKVEFLGANLRKITFDVVLDASLGVKPREILDTMETMVENGGVETLIIGSKQVGVNKWRMVSLSEVWNILYSKGELARATVSISLEEYK